WKPIIQEENIPVVHHIVLYECIVPEGNSSDVFESHVGRVESCYTPNMPPECSPYCWTQPIVWTIGGEGDMFATHTGMPLGEKHRGSTYFFMEMHYDIPELVPFIDSSAIRIYYTEKPRPEDLSTLFIGKRFSTFHFIAPRAVGYQAFGGWCTSECTQKAIPETGITATHALLHAHQVTKKIMLRHI
ncbi:DBH-like monooxygenase protein 1, partial [Folsomia candida]